MKKVIFIALISALFMCSCKEKEDTEPKVIEPTEVNIEPSNLVFTLGDLPQTVIATILPEGTPDDTLIEWSSTDSTVAFAIEGVVTAYKVGECDIVATTPNGKKGICKVIVNAAPVKVTDVIIEQDNYKLVLGDQVTILAQVFPRNSSNLEVDVIIEDETILTKEGDIFTGIKVGTTKVRFTSKANSDKFAEANIEVGPKMEFVDPADGQIYKTVKIGEQVWFAENFRRIKWVSPLEDKSAFSDYTYIYGYDGDDTKAAKETDNYKTFGVLYNQAAASLYTPEGWHLPTTADWQELERFLGMSEEEVNGMYNQGHIGNKLKGVTTWTDMSNAGSSDVEEGNDEVGFNALAGGTTCKFWAWEYKWNNINAEGIFWSSKASMTHGETYSLKAGKDFIYRCEVPREVAISVRYVKDKE